MTTPSAFSSNSAKTALRHVLRRRRLALGRWQQRRAAVAVLARICQARLLQRVQRAALYLATDGEMDTKALRDYCWDHGIALYLPKIQPAKQLSFHLYAPRSRLSKNHYGIDEPARFAPQLNARYLDIVFLPLVGFDKSGRRLGMGGGYYDRSFAFKARRGAGKPLLVGLAHACQRVPALPSEAWDVPLDYIVSDRELICVAPRYRAATRLASPLKI